MSILKQLIDGSLVSRQRLMQAREFYSPRQANVSARVAFSWWANRVSEQLPMTTARELAGLSEPELEQLEAEFVSCPLRPPVPWVRYAAVVGLVLIATAGLGLALSVIASLGASASRVVQIASVAFLLIGLVPLGSALLSAFAGLHLDLSHGTTGLYVGKLDEQHPWLYSALALTKHSVADEYRQGILRKRGPLRGADYVMMRELVRAEEALENVRAARSVAERLQSSPLATQAITQEPRLVRVPRARDSGEVHEAETSRALAN